VLPVRTGFAYHNCVHIKHQIASTGSENRSKALSISLLLCCLVTVLSYSPKVKHQSGNRCIYTQRTLALYSGFIMSTITYQYVTKRQFVVDL
jgi:hypothetical protein